MTRVAEANAFARPSPSFLPRLERAFFVGPIPSQVLLILLRVMLRSPRFSAGTPSPSLAILFNRHLHHAKQAPKDERESPMAAKMTTTKNARVPGFRGSRRCRRPWPPTPFRPSCPMPASAISHREKCKGSV